MIPKQLNSKLPDTKSAVEEQMLGSWDRQENKNRDLEFMENVLNWYSVCLHIEHNLTRRGSLDSVVPCSPLASHPQSSGTRSTNATTEYYCAFALRLFAKTVWTRHRSHTHSLLCYGALQYYCISTKRHNFDFKGYYSEKQNKRCSAGTAHADLTS